MSGHQPEATMTPSERELIHKVAEGLRTTDRSAIDPDAEQFIRAEVAGQPHAAYLLTQRVIVQDLALSRAQARINELEARLQQAGGSPGSGGSFLGGAAGGGSYPPPAGYVPQGSSPGYAPSAAAPAPAASGGGVGGFLKTAAAAAAGTVAGELIFDGVRHLAAGYTGGGLGGLLPGGHTTEGSSWGGGGRHTSSGEFIPDDRATDSPQDAGSGGDFGNTTTEDLEDPVPDDDVEVDEPEPEADAGAGGDFADDENRGDADSGADW